MSTGTGTDPLAWRAMHEADVAGVVAVAHAAFPDHFEARECFDERLTLYPEGCRVLAAGAGGEEGTVRGYLIAYPWPLGAIPPLNSALGALPADIDAFYLHDLALHPEARGSGQARPAVEWLMERLRVQGARHVALVSVNGTVPFWRAMGFAPAPGDAATVRKLESYGADARYMVRWL